jgi:lipid-A-disaccharide synthase
MRRWVDRLAVVFPFEEELFREAGVEARFVGHPLVDDLAAEIGPEALRSRLGFDPSARMIGLLPGSRRGEFRAHCGVLTAAARAVCGGRSGVRGVVAVAPGLEDLVPVELNDPASPVRAAIGVTHAIQAAAECCAVASGTATLETALFGTPLVVVYRTGALNYAIARRLVRLRHIGLPNIVAGEEVAPERIQGACTPDAIAAPLARWLDDSGAREEARRKLGAVRARLGGPGASRRAAAWLREMLA